MSFRCSTLIGESSHFDSRFCFVLQMSWNHQLDKVHTVNSSDWGLGHSDGHGQGIFWTVFVFNNGSTYPINGKTKPYILMGTIIYRHSQSIVLQNPPFWILMIWWIYKPHVMILTFDIHRWHIFFKTIPPKQKTHVFCCGQKLGMQYKVIYIYIIYIYMCTLPLHISCLYTLINPKKNQPSESFPFCWPFPQFLFFLFFLWGGNPGQVHELTRWWVELSFMMLCRHGDIWGEFPGRFLPPKKGGGVVLGGGNFKYILFSTRSLEKMNPFCLSHIFQTGWNSTTN